MTRVTQARRHLLSNAIAVYPKSEREEFQYAFENIFGLPSSATRTDTNPVEIVIHNIALNHNCKH